MNGPPYIPPVEDCFECGGDGCDACQGEGRVMRFEMGPGVTATIPVKRGSEADRSEAVWLTYGSVRHDRLR